MQFLSWWHPHQNGPRMTQDPILCITYFVQIRRGADMPYNSWMSKPNDPKYSKVSTRMGAAPDPSKYAVTCCDMLWHAVTCCDMLWHCNWVMRVLFLRIVLKLNSWDLLESAGICWKSDKLPNSCNGILQLIQPQSGFHFAQDQHVCQSVARWIRPIACHATFTATLFPYVSMVGEFS